VSTLFFVPVVFAGVHRWLAQRKAERGTPAHRPMIASQET
jgi:hypothetical protein